MWVSQRAIRQRVPQFFRLALATDTYFNIYHTNFDLMLFWHFSLNDINEMYPYERAIYTNLLRQHIENESKRRGNRG